MAALAGLRAGIEPLRQALRNADFDVPAVPGDEAPSRDYAFWFAFIAFLLQTSQRRDERVSAQVGDAYRAMARTFREILLKILPSLPPDATYSVLAWAATIPAAATGGDCYCRHGSSGVVAMDLIRNHPNPPQPEFEMTCAAAHTTTYDTHGSFNDVRKN